MFQSTNTLLLHADNAHGRADVSPPISVSTTFRIPHDATDIDMFDPAIGKHHVYSRYSQDVNCRLEQVLGPLHGEGKRAITFTSGLSAGFVALMHLQPRRVAITGGYFGFHSTIKLLQRASRDTIEVIDLDDEYREGDVCWLETPVNPLGEARDIEAYATRIHAVGGKLVVDSTFAPPPVSNPFDFGADMVMHSGTKYFGGHSDLLSGVLVVKTLDEWRELWNIRTFLGNVMGSLEAWLMLRSLRTFSVRIPQQSKTATALVKWLAELAKVPAGKTWDGVPGGLIHSVRHASLQTEEFVKKQHPEYYPATFAFMLADEKHAGALGYSLKLFAPATSLGGVESLIEQRFRADGVSDPRLLRVSIGLEDLKDLQADMRQGFNKLTKGSAKL